MTPEACTCVTVHGTCAGRPAPRGEQGEAEREGGMKASGLWDPEGVAGARG